MNARTGLAAAGLPVPDAVPKRLDIRGIAYDSRQVQPGYCFVALPGHCQDGRTFVADAVRRGAALIVGEGVLPDGPVPRVTVPAARQALADLAVVFYGEPSRKLNVTGVTGTNGKTTTTFMLRALLAGGVRRVGMIGTVCYEIGERVIPAGRTTPEATDIQRLLREMERGGCSHVVMEVSSHALDQQRVRGVAFNAVVFTNLTRDHLDYHGDMEHYFATKRLLFTEHYDAAKDTLAVVNEDDPHGQRLIKELRGQSGRTLLTCGCGAGAHIRAETVRCTATGTHAEVMTPWGRAPLRLLQLGRYNLHNALAAIAVGGAQGLPLAGMVAALEHMPGVPGRLEAVLPGHGVRVFVDYAHTDDALQNVCTMLREITPGRLWLVFGCGGDRDRSKRGPMGAVAAHHAHHVFITSDNPRSENPQTIADEIVAGFGTATHYTVELDRAAAIRAAIQAAAPGDTVVIAGKGHEKYQEFGHTMVPFDDVAVARVVLQEGAS